MKKNQKSQGLTSKQIVEIITKWDRKSMPEFAEEFGLSQATIRNCVTRIRKLYPDKCPKKPRSNRDEAIHSAMRILEQTETPSTTAAGIQQSADS